MEKTKIIIPNDEELIETVMKTELEYQQQMKDLNDKYNKSLMFSKIMLACVIIMVIMAIAATITKLHILAIITLVICLLMIIIGVVNIKLTNEIYVHKADEIKRKYDKMRNKIVEITIDMMENNESEEK